jgi:hypothetical protein
MGIPVGDFDIGVPGLAHLHIAVHPGTRISEIAEWRASCSLIDGTPAACASTANRRDT